MWRVTTQELHENLYAFAAAIWGGRVKGGAVVYFAIRKLFEFLLIAK
jgi:hypothetical protein